MLLNAKCSWSYKSITVTNGTETPEQKSNEKSTFLNKNFRVNKVCRTDSKTFHDTSRNNKSANTFKRKFFDLEDGVQDVNDSLADPTYDFNEFSQEKSVKIPRKRTIKKKTDKVLSKPVANSGKGRYSRSTKNVNFVDLDSESERDYGKDDQPIQYQLVDKINNANSNKLNFKKDNQQIQIQSDDKTSPISWFDQDSNQDNVQITLSPVDDFKGFSKDKIFEKSVKRVVKKRNENVINKPVVTNVKKRYSQRRKNINYVESEADSDQDDQQIQHQPVDTVSHVNLNELNCIKNNQEIQRHSDDRIKSVTFAGQEYHKDDEQNTFPPNGEINPVTLNKHNREVKKHAKKVTQISIINEKEGSYLSDDSDASDDGFIFQTRFSDKNANVADITNSIENDSPELFPTLNVMRENSSMSGSNMENNVDSLEQITEFLNSYEAEDQQNFVAEQSTSNPATTENSSNRAHNYYSDENRSIKESETNNEFHSGELYGDDGKCKKVDSEAVVAKSCSNVLQEILDNGNFNCQSKESDDEFENVSHETLNLVHTTYNSAEFSTIKKRKNTTKNVNITKTIMLNKKKNITEISEPISSDGENENFIELENGIVSKAGVQSKLKKNEFLSNENGKILSNTFNLRDNNVDSEFNSKRKNSYETKKGEPDFVHQKTSSISSDINSVIEEKNEADDSRSLSSEEILSPELPLRNSIQKWSGSCGDITKNSSEILCSDKNKSNLESQNVLSDFQSNKKHNYNLKNSTPAHDSNLSNRKTRSNGKNKIVERKKRPTQKTKQSQFRDLSNNALSANGNDENRNEGLASSNFSLVKNRNIILNSNQNEAIVATTRMNGEKNAPKPTTWDDLESKLLAEIDEPVDEFLPVNCLFNEKVFTFSQTTSNARGLKRRLEFRDEKRELEVEDAFSISSQDNSLQRTMKNKSMVKNLKPAEKMTPSPVSNRTICVESPSMKIINKTIAAMNSTTLDYFSHNQGDSTSSLSERSNLDVPTTEYSFSVLSTTIQTSSNKLSLTEKSSRYIQKVRDECKQGDQEVNKCNSNMKKILTSSCGKTQKGNSTKNVSKEEKNTITLNKMEFVEVSNCSTWKHLNEPSEVNSNISDGYSDSRNENRGSYSLRKHKQPTRTANTNNKNEFISKQKQTESFTNLIVNKERAMLKRENCLIDDKKIKTNFNSNTSMGNNYQNGDIVQKNSRKMAKQFNSKDKYIKYLKNLFKNDNIQENEMTSEDKLNDPQNDYSNQTKFLIEDDDLFSISSNDSEKDETGYHSQTSGLFCDVIQEDESM